MSSSSMSSSFVKNAIVLGLLSAIGPFAIDMYLPALPAIATDLQASTAATQMTLMAFFVAFGVCQIAYGPVSDMVGRKPPLYFGIVLFALGSIGCGLAPSITWLIVFRFVQGLGAASVMVIPRAIIRDLHTGADATRLMSLVMLVFSVSPILAPLVGSGLIVPFGWRAVFAAVTLASVLSFLLVAFVLQETRPPEERVEVSVRSVLDGFGELFRDWRFLGLTFIGGFGMASFLVFIASASFVYSGQYGLTPTQFSLAFALNAIGFFASSQMAAGLGERFGARRVVLWATAGFALCAVALSLLVAAGFAALPVIIGGLLLGNACLGLVMPTTMVMALDDHGDLAGLASSLGGTLQMLAAGAAAALGGVFFDGTALPMVIAIALCSLISLTLAVLTLGRPRQPSQAPGQ